MGRITLNPPGKLPGNWFRDPTQLMFSLVNESLLLLKDTLSTTVAASSDATFTSWMDDKGARFANTANDTWETMVDISGGGLLGNILSADSGDMGLRVWVDNYPMLEIVQAVFGYRVVLGTIGTVAPQTSTTVKNLDWFNHDQDWGFTTNTTAVRNHQVPNTQSYTIAIPEFLKNMGAPLLRFDHRLKIDVKGTTGEYSAVTYILDA